jgi:hypothetical protein
VVPVAIPADKLGLIEMGLHSIELDIRRNNLNHNLHPEVWIDDQLSPLRPEVCDNIARFWNVIKPLIVHWWEAYKAWEAKDHFNKAFQDQRMTVRTYPAGFEGEEKGFTKQVRKTFDSISVASYNKAVRETEVRIFADTRYTPLGKDELKTHDTVFHKSDESRHYHANRGIDSSAFAKPENFATREKKYESGLHDLSASLVNPKLSIFDQIHNNEEGTYFSFLPLSKEDDQAVLFCLIRAGKLLKGRLPELSNLVRDYKAEMTRVKLANEFDMAIGYTASPKANPGTGPVYSLRYGLGKSTTVLGPTGQQTVQVTPAIYAARQQAALKFQSILGIREAKNEIVIAIRKHASGNFPIYGMRQGSLIQCFTISGDTKVFTGKSITSTGVMS